MVEENSLTILSYFANLKSTVTFRPLFTPLLEIFRNIRECLSKYVEEVWAVSRKILIQDFILSNVYSHQLSQLYHNIATLTSMDSTTDKIKKKRRKHFCWREEISGSRVDIGSREPWTEKSKHPLKERYL